MPIIENGNLKSVNNFGKRGRYFLPFSSKLIPKTLDFQFKMKLSTQTDSNILCSMFMLKLSLLTWKYFFSGPIRSKQEKLSDEDKTWYLD